MSVKKIISLIISIIAIVLLGFGITWSVINFTKVKTAMSGSELFTKQELEEYGDNMYNQALADKQSYLDLISEYRDTITSLNDEVAKLNYDIKVKNENLASKTAEVDSLKIQLNNIKNELDALKSSNKVNLDRISELEVEVEYLTSSIEMKEKEISLLTKQKNDYLESINYYKNFISTLETDTSAVATFEYDGQVIHMQVLTKGSFATFNAPADTDYAKFNYWMVNGVEVNLSDYPVNTNTTFVANIDKSFDITYFVDNQEYASRIALENTKLSTIDNPTKDGYTFLGWSLDGVTIISSDYVITSNLELHAVFIGLDWDVSYISEDNVVYSEIVKTNNFPIGYVVDSTNKKVFKGWSLDGSTIIDITSYSITQDTTFIAVFDYYYSVDYVVNGNIEKSISIKNGEYITAYTPIENDAYGFLGWTIDGTSIVDITTIEVTENMQVIAKVLLKHFEISLNKNTADSVTIGTPVDPSSPYLNVIEYYDFSSYDYSKLNIHLKYVIHNGSKDVVINVDLYNGSEFYDFMKNYNYYPSDSLDNHADISVSLSNNKLSMAVYYYGTCAGWQNCDFDIVLTFDYVG